MFKKIWNLGKQSFYPFYRHPKLPVPRIKTREIRWFTAGVDENILKWFAARHQSFEHTPSRTDLYLLTDKDDTTIKLREGKIEIKQRNGAGSSGHLTSSAEGYFENWTKWCFNLDDSKVAQLTSEIVENWIEVVKTRLGVKVALGNNNQPIIHPLSEEIESGWQVEYTKVEIGNKAYYTFCVEQFGEADFQLPEDFICRILGSTQLNVRDSIGYGEILAK